MRRREFLGAVGVGGATAVGGCAGLLETTPGREPPLVENRPDATYYPTHVEEMRMAGTQRGGGYECTLTYTYPHRFWLVTGRDREMVSVTQNDAMHLMPMVRDAEAGIVPPDVNPNVTIERDGERVRQLSPWAMLSQPMGFHFGDNVQLPGDGTYDVTVRVGSPSTRRTGALAAERDPTTFEFTLEYDRASMDEIPFRDIPPEREGTRGAIEPMDMMDPWRVPTEDAFPGTVRGTVTTGDARMVVATLDDASRFGGGDDETYLAVSPRTPYNRYPLPLMSLSATLSGGGEARFDDALVPTLDPDLGYHYGASVTGVASGDDLTVTVDAPPQTARHEGYETAFLDMSEATLRL